MRAALDDQIKGVSSFRGVPGEDECLVCFSKLSQTGTFAHLLWEGERARFCTHECFEIFQNNPNSFMRRLKTRVVKPASTEIVPEDELRRLPSGSP